MLLHPDTREPQIVMILKDRMTYVVLDPSVADDLKAVRALHPGDPSFAGRDDADTTWLVGFTNDAGPVPYFMYDRATRTGPVPVRAPARAVRVRARAPWSRSRSRRGTAWRSTGT